MLLLLLLLLLHPRLLPTKGPKETGQKLRMSGPVPNHGFENVVFSDRFVVVAGATKAAVEVDYSWASGAGVVLGL